MLVVITEVKSGVITNQRIFSDGVALANWIKWWLREFECKVSAEMSADV